MFKLLLSPRSVRAAAGPSVRDERVQHLTRDPQAEPHFRRLRRFPSGTARAARRLRVCCGWTPSFNYWPIKLAHSTRESVTASAVPNAAENTAFMCEIRDPVPRGLGQSHGAKRAVYEKRQLPSDRFQQLAERCLTQLHHRLWVPLYLADERISIN